MKVIFIGSHCSEQYVNYLIQHNSFPDFAGINLQRAILNGFSSNSTIVESFTTPFSISYPKSKLKNLNSETSVSQNSITHVIGYCNFPIIKILSKYFNLKRKLKINLTSSFEKPTVFVYSLQSPHLFAILANRKKLGKICVMITDLPQFMSKNKNIFYRIGKWFDVKIINHCLKKIDCFVLLSEKMCDYLPLKNKQYIVIEGIYSNKEIENSIDRNAMNIIMYSGGISMRYNIFDLIKAFTEASIPNAELWLCGPVDNKELLNNYIEADQRIKYLGMLPNKDVRKLQQKASLLVNPRFSFDEYTKYSFPSKTLEYMASGTPTLMCHLPSLPLEYNEYLNFIENENVNGIKTALETFFSLSLEERLDKAKKARDFILKKKSDKVQTSRILSLLKNSK